MWIIQGFTLSSELLYWKGRCWTTTARLALRWLQGKSWWKLLQFHTHFFARKSIFGKIEQLFSYFIFIPIKICYNLNVPWKAWRKEIRCKLKIKAFYEAVLNMKRDSDFRGPHQGHAKNSLLAWPRSPKSWKCLQIVCFFMLAQLADINECDFSWCVPKNRHRFWWNSPSASATVA